MDSDVNLKVIDDNKVTIHGNSNQTISNQLTHKKKHKQKSHTKHKHTITFDIRRHAESEAELFQ